jgi:hypothetical protein
LEDPGINESIVLKWIFEKGVGGIGWIDLAQDIDRRQAVVNTITNLQVS